MKTNVGHIYSIGDVRGEPMLAHKATHEGSLAAEVIAGHNESWDVRSIPSVAYTDPEVAWTGLTETQAKAEGIEVETAGLPVGRVRPRAGHGPLRRARRSSCSSRARTGSSARASSAPTPASCWPRRCWRSRPASTPRTSR